MHGRGTFVDSAGDRKEGEWSNGARIRWCEWSPQGNNSTSKMYVPIRKTESQAILQDRVPGQRRSSAFLGGLLRVKGKAILKKTEDDEEDENGEQKNESPETKK